MHVYIEINNGKAENNYYSVFDISCLHDCDRLKGAVIFFVLQNIYG